MAGAPVGTTFWLQWLLTFLGFPLGGSLAYGLVRSVDGAADAAIAGVAAGAVIGALQWLVLRQQIPVGAWWVAVTGIGFAVGLAVGVGLIGTGTSAQALLARGLIAGLAIGLLQWLLLRQFVAMALWWIPAIGLAWAAGWLVTRAAGVDLSRGWAVFGSTGALAFAALSGALMVWLLRNPIR
jgi:hypothetical protein